MKKTLAFILALTLVLSLCGQAFAQETDYEAEALQKAREAWAAQSPTDPFQTVIEGNFGPAAADAYELSLGIQGDMPATTLAMAKMIADYASVDVPLDLELLGRALEAAADSETQERIRAEMQWGRPRALAMPPAVIGGEQTVMAEFTYDEAGRRTAITTDDYTVVYVYDENGQRIEKRLEAGEQRYVIRYSYDAEGRQIGRDLDANGQTAHFRWDYDPQGRLIRSEPAAAGTDQILTFTWNENGELTGIGDGEGAQWQPEYDSDAHGFLLELSFDENRTVYHGSFDEEHRLTYTEFGSDALTTVSEMEYDEGGSCLMTRVNNKLANNQSTTETFYNAYGCQTEMKQGTKSEQTDYEMTFEYKRDEFGRCTAIEAHTGEGIYASSLTIYLNY